MTVTLYHHDTGEHLGSWYPEEDQVEVPRKGDIVWIDTDANGHDRWRVVNVQWAFRNKQLGVTRTRSVSAEIHVKPYTTAPLLRRFLNLFPSAT